MDTANLLFPTEPTAAPQGAPVASPASATPTAASILFGDSKPATQAAQPPRDAIDEAFPSEARPDPAASVADTLEPWAASAQAEGNADQAEAIRETSAALAQDFRDSGMSQDDVSEVMGLAREALGNTMPNLPVSDERLAEMRTAAESFIAENQIAPDDIALAQRLVADLDAKTGGRVSEYLIDTGMGNRPETILKAIEIAKRRYGG
ncbi:hypothetical protein PE067_18255 [Paracoccus sp. DMF-8]|uniref:hypothetical protein n=1 Tax=Paracoccus sp. DMF-8 TaxID=3019445 RepID=UPI0023E359FF|nr:hypothetical protein [Paracoccus sp. DMF-8]MDF3607909.1 hypothetical protein [Paracoccus sp. DMF-8]